MILYVLIDRNYEVSRPLGVYTYEEMNNKMKEYLPEAIEYKNKNIREVKEELEEDKKKYRVDELEPNDPALNGYYLKEKYHQLRLQEWERIDDDSLIIAYMGHENLFFYGAEFHGTI